MIHAPMIGAQGERVAHVRQHVQRSTGEAFTISAPVRVPAPLPATATVPTATACYRVPGGLSPYYVCSYS